VFSFELRLETLSETLRQRARDIHLYFNSTTIRHCTCTFFALCTQHCPQPLLIRFSQVFNLLKIWPCSKQRWEAQSNESR